jgi:hypothetical protein
MLEYFETLAVAVIERIDAAMVAAGRSGILDRIGAIIGGSMGGNLALRLSERLGEDRLY